ncbi:hypothetical protein D9611_005324 [Ephemerocybe angulata]|uniref:Uncharacterized protein n=1 Tax=Ephemerocybe angulata TaxID=980116 RepID=A0A8H5C109_9AGAR|nr:hypothetical protein D9611_005324 [Tulosesus angulatus]
MTWARGPLLRTAVPSLYLFLQLFSEHWRRITILYHYRLGLEGPCFARIYIFLWMFSYTGRGRCGEPDRRMDSSIFIQICSNCPPYSSLALFHQPVQRNDYPLPRPLGYTTFPWPMAPEVLRKCLCLPARSRATGTRSFHFPESRDFASVPMVPKWRPSVGNTSSLCAKILFAPAMILVAGADSIPTCIQPHSRRFMKFQIDDAQVRTSNDAGLLDPKASWLSNDSMRDPLFRTQPQTSTSTAPRQTTQRLVDEHPL